VPQLTRAQRRRVESHLYLIDIIVRKMQRRLPAHVDLDDVRQNAFLGLVAASKRFEPGRGYLFRTFAGWRIQGAVVDALRRSSWPRAVRRVRREMDGARRELRQALGGEPSQAEVGQALGWTVGQVARAEHRVALVEATVVAPVEPERVLAALSPATPEQVLEAEETNTNLRAAMSLLPERDQKLLKLYYQDGKTMAQVAKRLKVSQSRVGQLHQEALASLRRLLQ
jgi:RNA polymerase sigma factor for flagellar operon FliA